MPMTQYSPIIGYADNEGGEGESEGGRREERQPQTFQGREGGEMRQSKRRTEAVNVFLR